MRSACGCPFFIGQEARGETTSANNAKGSVMLYRLGVLPVVK